MASKKARKNQKARPFPLAAAALAVVAGAAIVAAAVAGGDETPEEDRERRPVEVSGAALPRLAGSGSDPAVGSVAPSLRGSDFDGSPVAIEADGRPKLVVFLAHWCPHCQREVPLLAGWLADGGLTEDVDMYAVATATDPNRPNYPPSEWLEREGLEVPVLADGADNPAAGAFGLSSYPYFVLLDGDQRVLLRDTGELTIARLEEMVALAG